MLGKTYNGMDLENNEWELGLRDAIHVPIVLVRCDKDDNSSLKPSEYVRFTNEECTRVEPCEKGVAEGIVDPFLNEGVWGGKYPDYFFVLLKPNSTTPVRHTYDIKRYDKDSLEEELRRAQQADPGCASCYDIQDGKVIRW